MSKFFYKYAFFHLNSFLERRKRQRVENAINRRREFQERFPNIEPSARSRVSRQSPDTGVYISNE